MNIEQKRDYVVALQRLSSLLSEEMRKALDDYQTEQTIIGKKHSRKTHQKSKRKTRQ
jgi:hypothetical protein